MSASNMYDRISRMLERASVQHQMSLQVRAEFTCEPDFNHENKDGHHVSTSPTIDN